MPCNDGGGPLNFDSRRDYEYQRDRMDDLASRLCGLCSRVEEIGRSDLIAADPSLKSWWLNHKSADIKRRQKEAADKHREAMRNQVLAKLTSEEIEILGLRK